MSIVVKHSHLLSILIKMKVYFIVGTTIIGIGVLTAEFLQYRKRKRIIATAPNLNDWHLVGYLARINIYPLKSSAALPLIDTVCDGFGITEKGIRDRSLVLLTAQDEIASVGVYPLMLSIKSEILDDLTIRLTAPNKQPLIVNVGEIVRREFPKVIYKRGKGYLLPLIECDNLHHKWFSEVILNSPIGLRLFIALAPSMPTYNFKPDHSALMVMNTKSVKELNSRLTEEDQVDYDQFRGNLLIDTDENISAYDEDKWMWLKIDNTILKFEEICTRCVIPNINVETCERNRNFEPLRTLKTYRLVSHPKEPDMGVRFNVYQSGRLSLGAAVYAQYK